MTSLKLKIARDFIICKIEHMWLVSVKYGHFINFVK